ALAVAEVELPHTNESIVIAECTNCRQVGQQVAPPLVQRACIVRADVFEMEYAHIARACNRSAERTDRRQAASGEDVALDEIDRALRALVALVGDGDRLQQHGAMRFQQPAALREISVEVLMSDRLDHLDGYQLVIGAGEIAIVRAEHFDLPIEPGLTHALASETILLLRDGGRGHFASIALRGVECEAAPAG